MTAEAPPPDPADAIRFLKTLGPIKAGRVLAIGWREADACVAIARTLRPTALAWVGPGLTRPGKTTTEIAGLDDAPEAGFDLVIGGPGLIDGPLATVQVRITALAARLTPGGVALLDLETLATPAQSGGAGDSLMFPASARAGALGPLARNRAALGPANWLLMLAHAGLTPETIDGYGAAPPAPDVQAEHGARLALYDEREIATPRLRVRALRTGGAA